MHNSIQHILCFELNTVKKYDAIKRGFSKQLETKASRPVSKEKNNKEEMGGLTLETLNSCRCAWKLEESVSCRNTKPFHFIFKQKLKIDLYSVRRM